MWSNLFSGRGIGIQIVCHRVGRDDIVLVKRFEGVKPMEIVHETHIPLLINDALVMSAFLRKPNPPRNCKVFRRNGSNSEHDLDDECIEVKFISIHLVIIWSSALSTSDQEDTGPVLRSGNVLLWNIFRVIMSYTTTILELLSSDTTGEMIDMQNL